MLNATVAIGMTTTPHVDPQQVYDLALVQSAAELFKQPEWIHIQTCEACARHYIEFLRRRVDEIDSPNRLE